MKYVTGLYGLNIENSKNTCGDWHCSALKWDNVWIVDSKESPLLDWV